MIRLIYISTARGEITQGDLECILRKSRRNNAAVGVTGLLIAGGRRFLQVLEGPTDVVMETYERIQADERHFATVLLSKRTVTERNFESWAMGYQPAGPIHGDGSVADDVASLIAPIADPTVHAYFAEFAKKHAA